MKKIIYVDMDNTLLDTFNYAREYSKKSIYGGAAHINTTIKLIEPPEDAMYNYSTTSYLEACGMTHNEAVLMRQYLFHSLDYWRTIPFMPGAEEVFRWLYENYDVYIATSAFLADSDECVLGKIRLIEERLSYFNMTNLIYSHAKYRLKGDLFIEDVWSQIEDFNGIRMLMDRPYNKEVKPDIRVQNWYQIKELLENFNENDLICSS